MPFQVCMSRSSYDSSLILTGISSKPYCPSNEIPSWGMQAEISVIPGIII